jgi:hypothetical protein
LIRFFCSSVNVTPDLLSAVMPFTGSFSALPSCLDVDSIDPNPAADRSIAASVAWSKTSLPLPASLRICLNVSSRFAPDWMSSSSTPVLSLSDPARSPTSFAVTFAAPPVDLIAASVCAAIRRDSSNARYVRTPNATPSAAPPAAA